MAQAAPKTSPVSLVFPDMLIDAFGADKRPPLFLQPAADLLRAPLFLRQFLLDLADEAWRHLTRHARCGGTPGGCFLLCLFVAIPFAASIAFDLVCDRRTVHADLPRNLGFGAAAFQERVNLATFVIGQVMMAFGHVSPVRCGSPTRG